MSSKSRRPATMSSSMRTRPAGSREAWGNNDRESENFLQQLESLQKKFPSFDDTMRKMEQQYADTKAAVYLLKEEYQSKNMIEMEQLKEQNKHYELEIERKDKTIKEFKEKMKSTTDELERTKTRLSQVMGNKLTNNNPNIADLSDVNRPSKLAERLNEIYDNDWTDAYTDLCEEKNEEETVAELLRTLMDIYEHCKQQWKLYMSNIERNLTGGQDIDIPDYVEKQLKDCAKNMATQLVELIYKNFIKMVARHPRRIFHSSECKRYIKGCVEVCWFMAAQDPPVVFGTESREGDKFDPKVFKPFTRTGDLISYVVWPPVYLQEGGPLLCKGVAQTHREEKEPWTGVSAYHMPLNRTGDQRIPLYKQQSYSNSQDLSKSNITEPINLYGRQDHSQAMSQPTFDTQIHTQQMKTYSRQNGQEPKKYQQSSLNLTSDHVHQQQIEISGISQDPTLAAMNPSLVWNHSRLPTEREMRHFSRLITTTSAQAARSQMGDQLFDLCNDFNKLKTELALLDRSTNESDI